MRARVLTHVALATVSIVMTGLKFATVDEVGRRRLALVMILGAPRALLARGTLFVIGLTGEDHPVLVVTASSSSDCSTPGLQVIDWPTRAEVDPPAVRVAGASAQARMVGRSNLPLTRTALAPIEAPGGSVETCGSTRASTSWPSRSFDG